MIKLQPVLKDYLWGGEKLKTLFGREKDGIIAESWEVSIHKDGESTISGTDKTFAEYLKENSEITVKEIADKLNKNESTIVRNIGKLKEQGVIERNGSDKTGSWKVIE